MVYDLGESDFGRHRSVPAVLIQRITVSGLLQLGCFGGKVSK